MANITLCRAVRTMPSVSLFSRCGVLSRTRTLSVSAFPRATPLVMKRVNKHQVDSASHWKSQFDKDASSRKAAEQELDHAPVNEDIESETVYAIGGDGRPLGVIPLVEAIRQAQEDGLDVVQVGTHGEHGVPVTRYMNVKKAAYQRQKQAKKQTAAPQMKEVQLSSRTEANDFVVKVMKVRKFLEAGHSVRVVVQSRNFSENDIAINVLDEVLRDLEGIGVPETRHVDAPRAPVDPNVPPPRLRPFAILLPASVAAAKAKARSTASKRTVPDAS